MSYTTPESAGISSSALLRYMNELEGAGLSIHSMLLSRGDDLLLESYWAPFDAAFLHRQYSVSKSVVALAVGFAVDDGLLTLDDRISDHFERYLTARQDGHYCRQTVRDMLMMATEKVDQNWFRSPCSDRLATYFTNTRPETKGHGMLFDYDSSGAFVLGALVEQVTGRTLTEYLREKIFDPIGVSKDAYFLLCPGGHAWGDSGLMCTARDLWKIARFVMKQGEWGGKQLLSAAYLRDATSALMFNNDLGVNDYDTHGYGYLIWRSYDRSFAFLGMGGQIALCLPDRDLCLIVNADNQGISWATKMMIDRFFELIAHPISPAPLSEDVPAQTALAASIATHRLAVALGKPTSPCSAAVSGKEYRMGHNAMGITRLCVEFDGTRGTFVYENAQGEKRLPFGLGYNVFGKFPQQGYADLVGNTTTEHYFYDCAASAGWVEENKLFIKVQIIDKYFGRLNIILSFAGETCAMRMVKTAENFLNEYQGFAEGSSL